MRDRIHCSCSRCTIRGLMGPAIVITIGVLFLLSEMRGGMFDFGNTYPVILIVIGVISLAGALAPMDGHVGAAIPPGPPAPPMPPVAAPGAPPPPFSGQGQGL